MALSLHRPGAYSISARGLIIVCTAVAIAWTRERWKETTSFAHNFFRPRDRLPVTEGTIGWQRSSLYPQVPVPSKSPPSLLLRTCARHTLPLYHYHFPCRRPPVAVDMIFSSGSAAVTGVITVSAVGLHQHAAQAFVVPPSAGALFSSCSGAPASAMANGGRSLSRPSSHLRMDAAAGDC